MAYNAPSAVVIEYKGTAMRAVRPYFYEFKTNYKDRWKGKTLLEVYEKEFESSHRNATLFYQTAIHKGLVRVNGELSPPDRRLIHGDAISRIAHRHEPPVLFSTLKDIVVLERPDLIVCNKPSTVPIHPAGSYRLNTLLMLLNSERPDLGQLFTVHRLDRLTSGLVIFARNSSTARTLSNAIQGHGNITPRKSYLAKVHGKFPNSRSEALGKPGILDYNLDYTVQNGAEGFRQKRRRVLESCDESTDNPTESSKISQAVSDEMLASEVASTSTASEIEWISVSFPLSVLDPKKGVHTCDVENGKESQSRFQLLQYDEATNTSIVKCEPLSGRTHQLRLHLQLIGHPIANDPNYGHEDEEPYDFEKRGWIGDSDFHKLCHEAFTKLPASSTEFTTELMDSALELCEGCKREMEPIRHKEIWLHAYRFRLYDENHNCVDDLRVSIPNWAAEVEQGNP